MITGKKKILITGGAGYIGSCLTPKLLALGYDVCVYDCLLFGGQALLPCVSHENFKFIKGDVNDKGKLAEIIPQYDCIIHLAAIVGFPACRANPDLANVTNIKGTQNIVELMDDKKQVLFYGSTGSNYGALLHGLCDENTPLSPLSLYGKTKTKAEQIALDYGNSIAFRFATAFGIAPRMRVDLLVNSLTLDAIKQRYMVVYEAHFMRTFIHVEDIAESFIFALERWQSMTGQVYNVGDDSLNYSKLQLCEIISKITGAEIHLADSGKDEDQRNYQVSYKKIKDLGFKCHIDIEHGIKGLVNGLNLIEETSQFRNV